ncbi:MAG: phenylalanine--tRNA ligase subunit beta [bacterium]|nr:phenylalanine--tRNA ligase subunit beta [bacterium]
MLISYNWLKSFFETPPPAEKEIFEKLGLEVERSYELKEDFEGIEVVEIKEIKDIDDRLKFVRLSNGRYVVCGAPNVRVGLKSLYINPGYKLGEKVVSVKEIKGFKSEGMLLSSYEAQFGKQMNKIVELHPSTEIKTLNEHFELPDIIFEINVPPNQAYLLSHYWIAWYISRFFKYKLKFEYEFFVPRQVKMDYDFKIESSNCTSYILVKFDNLKDFIDLKIVGRLYKMGAKSINAAVDITNYVLFGFGHPTHAFDAKKISGKKIYIRDGKAKDFAIDGCEYEFDGCLIMDEVKPIAAGGIIGFKNSEVDDNTNTVLIEIANFIAPHIRRHSKKTVSTESSYRFERGLSEVTMVVALQNIIEEFKKISDFAGIKVALSKPVIKTHRFSLSEAFSFLGINYEKKQVLNFLKGISIDLKVKNDVVMLKTYSFIADIKEDIFEEILKFTGFESIKTQPKKYEIKLQKLDFVRAYFISNGFNEIYSSGLQKYEVSELFGRPVKVLNPIVKDLNSLRTSIIPDIVHVINTNLSYGLTKVAVFEVAEIWNSGVEEKRIACGFYNYEPHWIKFDELKNFYWFKGIFEGILDIMGLEFEYVESLHPYFDKVYVKDRILFGTKRLKTGFVFLFETPVYDLKLKESYNIPSQLPASIRDMSIFVDKDVKFKDIKEVVCEVAAPFLESIHLFDVYDHKDKKSFTFRIVLRGVEKTFESEDVNKVVERIFKRLEEKLNAKPRTL